MWACIAYITSYICKPEKTMSELMSKASNEAQDKGVAARLYHIGNQLRNTDARGTNLPPRFFLTFCLQIYFQ